MSDLDLNDWPPEARERLLAWMLVDPPGWYQPLTWLLLTFRCPRLADRLFRWWGRRAVFILRDRPDGSKVGS